MKKRKQKHWGILIVIGLGRLIVSLIDLIIE